MSREFYDYDRARDFARQDWIDLQIEDAEAKKAKDSKPPEPPLVVRPGSHWAAAAFKAGREDEYIDAMKSRYGDEW